MSVPFKPTPQPSFGVVPRTYDPGYFTSFMALLARRLSNLAGPNTVQQQILLQSTDGTVYEVTVSNTGVLTTTIATRGTIQPPL
jgi:hypothetical protein